MKEDQQSIQDIQELLGKRVIIRRPKNRNEFGILLHAQIDDKNRILFLGLEMENDGKYELSFDQANHSFDQASHSFDRKKTGLGIYLNALNRHPCMLLLMDLITIHHSTRSTIHHHSTTLKISQIKRDITPLIYYLDSESQNPPLLGNEALLKTINTKKGKLQISIFFRDSWIQVEPDLYHENYCDILNESERRKILITYNP